jgi:hypothetical protein
MSLSVEVALQVLRERAESLPREPDGIELLQDSRARARFVSRKVIYALRNGWSTCERVCDRCAAVFTPQGFRTRFCSRCRR